MMDTTQDIELDEAPEHVASCGEEEADTHQEPSKRLDADAILDTLVPSGIDWRDTVRRHPVGSVATIGIVGYLVGRAKGATIMSGLAAGLSATMMRHLSEVFEGDFFDFG